MRTGQYGSSERKVEFDTVDEACRSMHEGKGCCKHNINLDDNDLDDANEMCKEEFKKYSDQDNSGIKEELISQLMFESIDEAEKFYIAYAKAEGFDVRRRSVQVKGEMVKNRVWVCTRSGFRVPVKEGDCRKREPKPLTRCGCKATFRVSHDKFSNKYFVSKFENKHNHPLHVCLKRYMSSADKTMLSMMTTIGFKPSQVMYYLEQLAGGAGKLSFRRKDGYNWLNKLRAERIREGDMNTVISNFKNLKLLDERLFFKYTLDDEGALTKLFWCDGASRVEYEAFGDVLVFDSTYKTNTYLYPLVIFSGVNSHCSTCIFGAAILQNETIDSYQWVLQTFLEAMDGRIPEAVLTDQDAAMRSAIMSEFPGTRHRICSWHLCHNVRKNIKNSNFCNDFCSLMDKRCSIEELELSWTNLVEKHSLSKHSWVVDMYKKRERWAEAYFREHFMSMMTTTQRAESVNALIKLSVDHKMTITDFLTHYNRTLERLRSEFKYLQELSENENREVRESPLKSLEEHALSIYTLKIFVIVRKEIWDEQGLVGESRSKDGDGNDIFVFREDLDNGDSIIHTVTIDQTIPTFKCDCFKLESNGVPCRHIISSLKCLKIKKFPDNMIKRRWSIETGTILKKKLPDPISISDGFTRRFGEMNKECLVLSYVSSKTNSRYVDSLKRVREVVDEANEEVLMDSQCSNTPSPKKAEVDPDLSNEDVHDPPRRKSTRNVLDPSRIKTRGATSGKKQNCGKCGKPGHKSTTCLENPSTVVQQKKSSAKNSSGMEENSTPEATTCTKKTSTAAWRKKSSAKKSSVMKEKSTPLHNADQNLETPAQQSVQHGNIINNFQHVAQLPVVFNTHPNNNGYPLYYHAPYPFNPFCFQQTQLLPSNLTRPPGSGDVMGPNTTLLWQQQSVISPGCFPSLYPNVSSDIP